MLRVNEQAEEQADEQADEQVAQWSTREFHELLNVQCTYVHVHICASMSTCMCMGACGWMAAPESPPKSFKETKATHQKRGK